MMQVGLRFHLVHFKNSFSQTHMHDACMTQVRSCTCCSLRCWWFCVAAHQWGGTTCEAGAWPGGTCRWVQYSTVQYSILQYATATRICCMCGNTMPVSAALSRARA
jgi:hypothetical protein